MSGHHATNSDDQITASSRSNRDENDEDDLQSGNPSLSSFLESQTSSLRRQSTGSTPFSPISRGGDGRSLLTDEEAMKLHPRLTMLLSEQMSDVERNLYEMRLRSPLARSKRDSGGSNVTEISSLSTLRRDLSAAATSQDFNLNLDAADTTEQSALDTETDSYQGMSFSSFQNERDISEKSVPRDVSEKSYVIEDNDADRNKSSTHVQGESMTWNNSDTSFEISTSTLQQELAANNANVPKSSKETLGTVTEELGHDNNSHDGSISSMNRFSLVSVSLQPEELEYGIFDTETQQKQGIMSGEDKPVQEHHKENSALFLVLYSLPFLILGVFILVISTSVMSISPKSTSAKEWENIGGAMHEVISSDQKKMDFFASLVGQKVFIAGEPQHLAAQWMLQQKDTAETQAALAQRFMLAYFYHVTTKNGSTQWRSCNPPIATSAQTTNCIFERPVYDDKGNIISLNEISSTRWLSVDRHECSWAGVECKLSPSHKNGIHKSVVGLQLVGQIESHVFVSELLQLPDLASIGV